MFREIVMIDFRKPLAERKRGCCGPYRWTPSKPGNGRGFYSSSENALEMDEAGSSIRLRLEWANDHISGRLKYTTGYWCDEHGDGDTLQPVIARLPRGRGFLAGWSMGAGMCGAIDGHVYADAALAALAAHSIAERNGEDSIIDSIRQREEEEESAETGYALAGVRV